MTAIAPKAENISVLLPAHTTLDLATRRALIETISTMKAVMQQQQIDIATLKVAAGISS